MMRYLLLLSVLFLTACNKPNNKLKEIVTTADSVAINYFKGDGTMDTVVKVKIVRDSQVITQLGTLISAATTKVNLKCGYDGSLHFFKKNVVVIDIDFRMNDKDCMYFTFKLAGEMGSTILTQDAKQLLNTLNK